MAGNKITVRVHFSWWGRLYLTGVRLFAATFAMQPDMGKARATLMRAVRVTHG